MKWWELQIPLQGSCMFRLERHRNVYMHMPPFLYWLEIELRVLSSWKSLATLLNYFITGSDSVWSVMPFCRGCWVAPDLLLAMACTITSYWYITLLSLSPVVTFTHWRKPMLVFFLVSYSLNPCFLLSFINFCSSGLGSQVLSEQWTVTGLLLKWKSMMRLDVHNCFCSFRFRHF